MNLFPPNLSLPVETFIVHVYFVLLNYCQSEREQPEHASLAQDSSKRYTTIPRRGGE